MWAKCGQKRFEARLKPSETLESRHSCEWWFLRKLEEAVNLFDAYVKTHPGEIPDKEFFREYFWLFERPDEEGRVSCAEFDRVMHFVDGSYDLSAKVFSESKRLFNSFEDFVKYCQAKKTEE